MSEKTNTQLAKAHLIIENLLKKSKGSYKDAKEFLKNKEFSKPKWQEKLETAMKTVNPKTTLMLIDEDHPEASLHMVKNKPPSAKTLLAIEKMGSNTTIPEWLIVQGEFKISYEEEEGTKMNIHWNYVDTEDNTDGDRK